MSPFVAGGLTCLRLQVSHRQSVDLRREREFHSVWPLSDLADERREVLLADWMEVQQPASVEQFNQVRGTVGSRPRGRRLTMARRPGQHQLLKIRRHLMHSLSVLPSEVIDLHQLAVPTCERPGAVLAKPHVDLLQYHPLGRQLVAGEPGCRWLDRRDSVPGGYIRLERVRAIVRDTEAAQNLLAVVLNEAKHRRGVTRLIGKRPHAERRQQSVEITERNFEPPPQRPQVGGLVRGRD